MNKPLLLPASQHRSLLKNALLSLASIVCALVAGEILLRLRYLDDFWQPVLATSQLYRRAQQRRLTTVANGTQIVFSKALYRSDSLLGYALNPGRHDIELRRRDAAWKFHVTIDGDGWRVTGASKTSTPAREVWIFGDSIVWGWPLSDELTFPWLMQQELAGQARVRNFAAPGYGNTHELLALRHQLATGSRPAIVVVAYGDYFRVRNVAAPVRISQFTLLSAQLEDATHPRASLDTHGDLVIDYVPLFRPDAPGALELPSPPDAVQVAVTIKLLEEIKRLVDDAGAITVLAYLQGDDTSPIIEQARTLGFVIADLRLGLGEADGVAPFDAHPGVLSHRAYERKLLSVVKPMLSSAP